VNAKSSTAVSTIPKAQELASKLRREGMSVAVNLLDKKIGDQIKTATKQSIPFLIVIGEDEVKTGNYTLKKLDSGKERTVEGVAIADAIWSDIGTE